MIRSKVDDVAPCNAKGAQTSVLAPCAPEEKSRSRTAVNSSATLLRVVHCGSVISVAESAPTAKFTNSRAIVDANWLAVSAASAGHKNANDAKGRLSLFMTDAASVADAGVPMMASFGADFPGFDHPRWCSGAFNPGTISSCRNG